MKIFTDQRERIHDYFSEIWVKCPGCEQCAIIRAMNRETQDMFASRRLTCSACPRTADWAGHGMSYGQPTDPYFEHALWLQRPCCGEILWAYNPSHLEFLKNYIGATVRNRSSDPKFGWSNKSLASRLPKWMQIAKNRATILKGISHLEEKIRKVNQS